MIFAVKRGGGTERPYLLYRSANPPAMKGSSGQVSLHEKAYTVNSVDNNPSIFVSTGCAGLPGAKGHKEAYMLTLHIPNRV